MSVTTIRIANLQVEILRKPIKGMYLYVKEPHGKVQITAPNTTSEQLIKGFIISKLGWIRKSREALQNAEKKAKKTYTTGESHLFLGEEYPLKVIPTADNPRVTLGDDLCLHVSADATQEMKKSILDYFYRIELQQRIPKLFEKWTQIVKVQPYEVKIKSMQTRWGTCNPRAKRIWLSLKLVQTPTSCIEYVFVHEIVHLLEPNHSPRFYHLMDKFLPTWPDLKQTLNRFTTIVN